MSKPEAMAEEIFVSLDKNKKYLPVIRFLNSDGLRNGASRAKHWKKIGEKLNIGDASADSNTLYNHYKDASNFI